MGTDSWAAHQSRLLAAQMHKASTRPNGNYQHSEHQWGVVANVNAGPPPSVDLYLDGTQNDPDGNLTTGVSYLDNYTPNVGDTVLVYRGYGRNRTDRVVLSNLCGSATPKQLLLGGVDPVTRRYTQGPNAIWGGADAPLSDIGIDGDYYFRTDNFGIYFKDEGAWSPLSTGGGGGGGGVTSLLAGANIVLTPTDGLGNVKIDALFTSYSPIYATIAPFAATTVAPSTQVTVGNMLGVGAVNGITVSGNTLVVPQDGMYQISYQLAYASASASGVYEGHVAVNGSQWLTNRCVLSASIGGYANPGGTAQVALHAGDALSLMAWQTTGSTITTASSGTLSTQMPTYLSVNLIA